MGEAGQAKWYIWSTSSSILSVISCLMVSKFVLPSRCLTFSLLPVKKLSKQMTCRNNGWATYDSESKSKLICYRERKRPWSTYVIPSFNQVRAQVTAYEARSSGHEHPILFNAWLSFDGCGGVIAGRELGSRLCNLQGHPALSRPIALSTRIYE